MPVDISVEVIGVDKIQNLGRLPVEAFPGILKAASTHAKQVASDGVGGTASRSIMAESTAVSARVYSVMSRARVASIEEGRSPGDPLLHTSALRRWAQRVGFGDSLFSLAHAIQRRGVKGRFFMRESHRSTLVLLPSLVKAAGQEIRAKFGRLK